MEIGWVRGRMGFPKHSLTIIVKGTFQLSNNQLASLLHDKQLPLCGDLHHDDDPTASLLYESDFVPFKPKADLLLSGSCHVPGAKPRKSCPVTFAVGTWKRTLQVIGQRFWRHLDSAPRMTDPLTFRKGPIRYEYAFGGPGFNKNPLGKGLQPMNIDGEEQVPLPNIEEPPGLITDPRQQPQPAGFGPIARTWELRTSKSGTYDEQWLEARWPWYPEDFDWSFFNSAPAAQQLPNYLEGGESLYLENLVPETPQFHSNLPGERVRVFIAKNNDSSDHQDPFYEIRMNLDTLWIDAENQIMTLTWRGITETLSENCEDIDYIYAIKQNISDDQISLNNARKRMLTYTSPHQAEEIAIPSEQTTNPDIIEIGKDIEHFNQELDKDLGPELRRGLRSDPIATLRQIYRQRLTKAGKDPKIADDWDPAEDDQTKALHDAMQSEDLVGEPVNRDACLRQIAAGQSMANQDLRGGDFSHCDLGNADFSGALLIGANLRNANLSNANLLGANLQGADLSSATLTATNLFQADLAGAKLIEVVAVDVILDSANLETADLRGSEIRNSSAVRTNFTRTDFGAATLTGCNLDESDLSLCRMDRTTFDRSSLVSANLEGSQGESTDFSGCNLSRANFSENSQFLRARFVQIQADESVWDCAILSGSDFSGSSMRMTDFTGANLHSASFSHCDLAQAKFVNAHIENADFQRANLFQSSLEKSFLLGANFSYANLYESETRDSETEGATLENANLKMTKLALNSRKSK